MAGGDWSYRGSSGSIMIKVVMIVCAVAVVELIVMVTAV